MSGRSFEAIEKARKYPEEFMKACRANWIGDALEEARVNLHSQTGGGPWNRLAFYKMKAVAADSVPPPGKTVKPEGPVASWKTDPDQYDDSSVFARCEQLREYAVTLHCFGDLINDNGML